jgi:hypothetical protein
MAMGKDRTLFDALPGKGGEPDEKADAGKAEAQPFRTQKEAVEYINAQGFKCSTSKFCNDARRNLIPSCRDGGYEASALMGYAALHCQAREKTGDKAASAAMLERIKADAELKRLQAERARVRLEADQGNSMPRSLHESDLAARAAFFRREIETFVHRKGPDLIMAVGGESGRQPALVDWWKRETEAWMDAWAEDAEFGAAPDVAGDQDAQDAAGPDPGTSGIA